MVESTWPELGGKELRYLDHGWELTGTVDVRRNGETLAVEARQTDDVRGRTGRLFFGLQDSAHSLNPGNLGEHFDHVDDAGGDPQIVVKKGRRTYRYDVQRLEYE